MTSLVKPDLPLFVADPREIHPALTRLGSGMLGVKAYELWLTQQTILNSFDHSEFPDITVYLPKATVLTSEFFDAFMLSNDLHPEVLAKMSDEQVKQAFEQAEIPAAYRDGLNDLVSRKDNPLAVRPSAVIESQDNHRLSNVFSTKMIPNSHAQQEQRLAELISAIKLVLASSFFEKARSYLNTIGQSYTEESMAVIVQDVVGQACGDRFYPCISGVASSHNYYPSGQSKPEEGIVVLALGLAKTIHDGGLVWSYNPDYPNAPPPFSKLGDLLKCTQTLFWAINLSKPRNADNTGEEQYLVQEGLQQAETDGALKYLVSTYHLGSDRLHSGLSNKGPHALTFAPILGSHVLGFNKLIGRLLELFEHQLQSPVEIEFAVDLDHQDGLPAKVALLQVQPMLVSHERIGVKEEELFDPNVLVASEAVLGNGRQNNIRDIVFIKPEQFDVAFTRLIAHELASINESMEDLGAQYLLIGFGRWGASDPWLGMPVTWNQISAARVIVEATLPDIDTDLSQGSRFFQYLLSYNVLYLAVEDGSNHPINWEWLRRQEIVAETEFVTHVRAAEPLDIRVESASSRGVIRAS